VLADELLQATARLAEAERLLDQCYDEADFEGPCCELLAAEVDLFLRPDAARATDSASVGDKP
jgi:hypothetical protein